MAPEHIAPPSPVAAAPAIPVEIAPTAASVPGPAQPTQVAPDAPQAWREEIAGRVQEFRHRRAAIRGGYDATRTLDLDFEPKESKPGGEMAEEEHGGDWGEMERELVPSRSPRHGEAALDSVELEAPRGGVRILSGAAVQAGELSLDHADHDSGPVEILLESDRAASDENRSPASIINPRELLGRRFAAGCLDAGVFLLGEALFGAIFWYLTARAGGVSLWPIAKQPLIVGVVGFATACLIFFYFSTSVALSGSTPGLRWMGLGICNLEGNFPSGREALARAFGYLVSMSALFLGFAWAIFDVDGLTWHDLISGTYVTERR